MGWLIKNHDSEKRKECMKTIRSAIFSRQRQTVAHNLLWMIQAGQGGDVKRGVAKEEFEYETMAEGQSRGQQLR